MTKLPMHERYPLLRAIGKIADRKGLPCTISQREVQVAVRKAGKT